MKWRCVALRAGVHYPPNAVRAWDCMLMLTRSHQKWAAVAGRDNVIAPGHPYSSVENSAQGGGLGAKNKSMGFRINTDELSSFYPEGSELKINIGLLPNNNFHIYEARCSTTGQDTFTHRTGHKGSVNASDGSPTGDLENEAQFLQSKRDAGDRFFKSSFGSVNVHNVSGGVGGSDNRRWSYTTGAAGPSYFGKNAGVGQKFLAKSGNQVTGAGADIVDDLAANDPNFEAGGDNFFFWHDRTTRWMGTAYAAFPPEQAWENYQFQANDGNDGVLPNQAPDTALEKLSMVRQRQTL